MAYKPKKGRTVVDSRGLDVTKSYSSFWMDDRRGNEKFGGWSDNMRAGSDLVRMVKLANYRRAITNFVKITTKQEIPVMWAGSQSFTNGKAISLTTDIKEGNFDVTVGLALHESAHIILSDFKLLGEIGTRRNELVEAFIAGLQNNALCNINLVKSLFNWIEDRRIDNYIFSTSPGYKAYYHKLYDYYWNAENVTKGLKSSSFRDHNNVKHWTLHIFNMMNPAFNPKAMPGLDLVVKAIDLPNVGRLKSSQDALEVTLLIIAIMDKVMSTPKAQQIPQPKPQPKQDEEGEKQQDKQDTQSKENKEEVGSTEEEVNDEIDWDTDDSDIEATNSVENSQITNALDKQQKFVDGETNKKAADKKDITKLEAIQKDSIELQTVGDKETGISSALMYDITNPAKLAELSAMHEKINEINDVLKAFKSVSAEEKLKLWEEKQSLNNTIEASGINDYLWQSSSIVSEYKTSIQQGLEMGGLLGKKLQLHNESRERVDSRLRSGKIDNRRLSQAGYDIETVFKQIHMDTYKKANLRISLDGSGSMSGGDKWGSAIRMTIAIAKAASYTQGISVQVDIRVTGKSGRGKDVPVSLEIYNSKINKLNHLVDIIGKFSPNSLTPEGLCFEAMLKKNRFVKGTAELDSYFLNISDGEPYISTKYCGRTAYNHTQRQVNNIRNTQNIQVISFFLQGSNFTPFENCDPNYLDRNGFTTKEIYMAYHKKSQQQSFSNTPAGKAFKIMYGKDASVVDTSSAIEIAKELNKKFMAAKVSM